MQQTITNITATFPIQLLIVSFVDPFVQKLKIAFCLHAKGDGFLWPKPEHSE
jgi:hypothetical protein